MRVRAVPMQVDEARRHHQSAGIDDLDAIDRRCAQRFDHARTNSDIADGIQSGFRIHDAAIGDDQIEGLLGTQ